MERTNIVARVGGLYCGNYSVSSNNSGVATGRSSTTENEAGAGFSLAANIGWDYKLGQASERPKSTGSGYLGTKSRPCQELFICTMYGDTGRPIHSSNSPALRIGMRRNTKYGRRIIHAQLKNQTLLPLPKKQALPAVLPSLGVTMKKLR